MRRALFLTGLIVSLAGSVLASDLKIKVPEGMKAVATQNGDTLEISFVPIEDSPAPSLPNAIGVNANGAALPRNNSVQTTFGLLSPDPASSSGPASTSTTTKTTTVSSSSAPAPASLTDDALKKAVTALNFDRPLSAAPAFVALGITPENVAHPATPREFATSLLNGVDRTGTLQTGFALEVAPYQVFFGPQTTLSEYRNNFFTRLLYNFNVSVATTKASTNDDKAQRLALGMEVTLFDKGDPRLNPAVENLFKQVTMENPLPDYDPDMSEAEYNALVKAHYEKFDPNKAYVDGLEKIRAASWGKTAWNMAWAPTWVSLSGNADNLKYEGLTAWTTFAYGFEGVGALQGRAQFIAHVRYREGEEVVDPDNATIKAKQNTLFAAARLRWGRPDLSFSAEGAYIRIWDGLQGDDQSYRIGAVLEKKVANNLWLVLSLGEDFGVAGQASQLYSLGSFRLGSSDSPTFQSP